MEENNYNKLKKIYDDFKDTLNKNIKNMNKSLYIQNSEDCYLIEDAWDTQILNCFQKFNKSSKDISFPKNLPIFINNFNDIIEHLKIGKKLKLIKKQFIELLYQNESNLKNISIIRYYGGNNKIIIEFKDNKDDKALLLINPSDNSSIINRIFIIHIKNEDKLLLFKNLLSEENDSNITSNQKYKSFVISLNENQIQKPPQVSNYSNQNNNQQNSIEEKFKRDIISILIYIYYYKKYLNDEKEKAFNENNNYYLINIDWINILLKYCDYQKIVPLVKKISNKNPQINYMNLNGFIKSYVEILYKKNIINFEKEKIKDISDIQKIFTTKFNKCFIIPSKIFYLIKSSLFKNNTLPNYIKKIYLKNKNIYFIDFKNIIIGNLDKEFFLAKYILSYNSKEILESEKNIFASNKIEDYIKLRNCDINNNKIQKLIKENKIIGKFTPLIIVENKMIRCKTLINNHKTRIVKKISNNFNKINKNFCSKSLKRINYKVYTHINSKGNSLEKVYRTTEINPNSNLLNKSDIIKYNSKSMGKSSNKSKKNNKNNENEIIERKENINFKIKYETIKNENEQYKSKIKELESKINSFINNEKQNMEKLEKNERIIENQRKEIDKLMNMNKEIINALEFIKQKQINEKENNQIKKDELLEEKNKIKEIGLENNINEYEKNINFIKEQKILIENQKKDIEKREKELNEKYNLFKRENNDDEKKIKEFELDILTDKTIEEENCDVNIQNEKQSKQNDLKELVLKEKKLKISIKKSVLTNSKYDADEIINIIDNINKINNDNNSNDNSNDDINSSNNNYQDSGNQNLSLSKILSPIRSYERPTLIGLNNIGAISFMNASLQCFSQTKDLTNYFLNIKNENRIINNNISIKNKNEPQLCPLYLNLIKKLWDKNTYSKDFSPTIFSRTVEEMNPLFKEGQPGDCKDFIIFILEQFHKELKTIENNSNLNPKFFSLNNYDIKATYDYFMNDFKKEKSIIKDLFFGINETTNICLNCKQNYNSQGMENPISYNFQENNCIIFPLEDIKNYKNSFLENNGIYNYMYPENIVSINECFYYYQKTDAFSGPNQNYCSICKQLSDSLFTTKMFTSPNILILILNRGKDNIYDIKLDFTEILDITDFVLEKEKPRILYKLYGVITHIGPSGPNAHFVASCKSPVNNIWYRYDDSSVNQITNVQQDIINFPIPYILFYQKI